MEYGIAPVSVKPEAPQIPSRRKVIKKSDSTIETVVLDDDAFDHEKEVYKRDWFQYERDVKKYDKKAERWATNSAKMYRIVMQHCSSEMEERLQALQEWPRVKADQDVISSPSPSWKGMVMKSTTTPSVNGLLQLRLVS